MKELGHFPMSEHPGRFRTYLLPVLDEIRADRRRGRRRRAPRGAGSSEQACAVAGPRCLLGPTPAARPGGDSCRPISWRSSSRRTSAPWRSRPTARRSASRRAPSAGKRRCRPASSTSIGTGRRTTSSSSSSDEDSGRRALLARVWGDAADAFGPTVFYVILEDDDTVSEWAGSPRLAPPARPKP